MTYTPRPIVICFRRGYDDRKADIPVWIEKLAETEVLHSEIIVGKKLTFHGAIREVISKLLYEMKKERINEEKETQTKFPC